MPMVPQAGRSIAVESSTIVETIRIRIAPFDWSFPHDHSQDIEAHWSRQLAEKPGLFDGRVLLARDLEAVAGTLTGAAFVTGYKSFLCWRDFGFPGALVHNVFAMPALRAADGAFMLGRMSASTANAGRMYFPAGTPEPADAGADGVVDFDANILRELEEETGLTAADVTLDAHWTVLSAGPMVACLKIARSPLSSAELRDRTATFIAGQSEPELDGLFAMRSPADFDTARMAPFMIHYLVEAFAGS